MLHPLHSLPFEWHDLPVERIAITEKGVVIEVRPFNDAAGRYYRATLSLLEPDSITFDIQGKLSLKELVNIEITDLDVIESAPGRITGTLGILFGGSGYWAIHVTNAVWKVDQHGDQLPSHS